MGKMNKVKVGKVKEKVVQRVVAAPKRNKGKRSAPKGSSSSGLFGQLGYGIGSMLAGPAGGLTGLAAGKLISKITGFGDYKVSKNSISNGNSVPSFTNNGKGMRCMHREYLADVVGSTGFVNTTYSINPGLVQTFPWLSLIAADFEEYDMEGLVFEYRPTSGTAVSSTNSAMGVVILATDYDSIDPPFSTKQQMESYEYANSTVPFAGCIHPVECLKKLNVLGSQFIRTGAAPSGTDLRLYDVGQFQIATQGMQSVYTVGELWTSYDVVFRKPRLPKTIQLTSYARFWSAPEDSCTTATPLGTGLVLQSDSTLLSVLPYPGEPGFHSPGLIFTQPGNYAVYVQYSTSNAGGGVVGTSIAVTLGANLDNEARFFNYNDPPSVTLPFAYGASPKSKIEFHFLKVTGAGTGTDNAFEISGNTMTECNCTVVVTLMGNLPATLTRPRMDRNQVNLFRSLRVSDTPQPSPAVLPRPPFNRRDSQDSWMGHEEFKREESETF